jgi:Tyrosine phosphatase family
LTVGRHLDWDGCRNARDLGGIRTADGPQTRRGAVVRPDGLVTMLLLALVGVAPDDIAADYELSADRPPPPGAGAGGNGRRWSPQEALARRNTTARAVLLATLEAVDVEAYLRAGGLRDDQVAAVRARLLEQDGS